MKKTKKMNVALKSFAVLFSICFIVAVALAAVNALTAPKIEKADRAAEHAALRAVLPTATKFEEVAGDYPDTVEVLYRDMNGKGYAVILSAKGYDSAKPMKVAVGFDADGNILALHVISCQGETSGIGTKVTGESFLGQFIGKSAPLSGVDAISGATISSSAMIGAVEDACATVRDLAAKEVGA